MTGRELLKFRLSRQWTQQKMALKLGISQATVSRFEDGADDLTPLTVAKISAAVARIKAREETPARAAAGGRREVAS